MSVATGNFNNLNQLTSRTGSGAIRFKGRLSEPGTVTVGGVTATMSKGTNFTAMVSTSTGANLISVVATDYSTNSQTNTYQIIVTNNTEPQTLSYDLNGNLVSTVTASVTNTYTWDATNRLLKITQINSNNVKLTSEFAYDGYGRRVQRIESQNDTPQSTNQYVWTGSTLSEERDATGATVAKRFFALGEQINGTNYYFTKDHLGSIREMTDGTGAVRAQYSYDPYGTRTKLSGDLDADFGFTGHFYHAASGLYLTLFRVYDASSGRWLSRDPILERGGVNLYSYVLENPINQINSDGRNAEKGWAIYDAGRNGLDAAGNMPFVIGNGMPPMDLPSGAGPVIFAEKISIKNYDNVVDKVKSFCGASSNNSTN